MKRYFEIIYWVAATGLISLLFMSLADSYVAALLLAVMMLPGALFAKFFGGSISFKNRFKGIMDTLYFLLIILILEYLLIFLVYLYFYNFNYNFNFNIPKPSAVILNPLFIWILLLSFWRLEKFLAAKLEVDKARSRFIEFTSGRKKIKIAYDAILYIESCDDVVFVVVSDGLRYRTRMNITLWSNMLDDRFVRVHRAFIVNRSCICGMSEGRLKLTSGAEIDVSKRYREKVEEWFIVSDSLNNNG